MYFVSRASNSIYVHLCILKHFAVTVLCEMYCVDEINKPQRILCGHTLMPHWCYEEALIISLEVASSDSGINQAIEL